jgi:hypothetical protein
MQEIERVLELLPRAVERLRALSPQFRQPAPAS